MNKIITLLLSISILSMTSQVFAIDVPSQEQAGALEAKRNLLDMQMKYRNEISKPKGSLPKVEDMSKTPLDPEQEGEKVLISRIEVVGFTKFTVQDIRRITQGYEGRSLSMKEMQEIALKITDLYRQKGFISSQAFLPAQKVEQSVLRIQVAEGLVGDIVIKGNKHFSSPLVRKMFSISKGEVLDYKKMNKSLSKMNETKDRNVKSILAPGKEPRTTDIVLDVKDKIPIHVGVSYDNYGSRYLRKGRYQGTITHNNLTGHNDSATLLYQMAEGHKTYRLSSVNYTYPLTNETKVGFYIGNTQLQLGREYVDLEVRGKSKVYSVFLNQNVFSNESTSFTVNAAVDYKDVTNFFLGIVTNQDRLRVGRLSGNLDHTDAYGRTIINNEISQGVPHVLDGNGNKKSEDPPVSRAGAGSFFTKDVLDVLRLQPMPKNSTLLIKGQAQFSSHILTATEQFQVGGIANVRGFSSGDGVGDYGQSATAEWSFPLYFLPKELKVPLSKASLYDALRWTTFYDWGHATLRRPLSGERRSTTLQSYGVGARFDLPEDFYVKFDVAWPLNGSPSDGKNAHTWLKMGKDF